VGVSLPRDSDVKWEIEKVSEIQPRSIAMTPEMVIESFRPIPDVGDDLSINESTPLELGDKIS
jgi:hypothetical protein